ncbi:MAG TPA: hypothetical protein VKQ52_05290 [Puia sp.]|nr:hypothetical protein [Puia sp.]
MNEVIFETVLNDILDELKQANDRLRVMKESVKGLEERVAAFEQRLTELQVTAPPADVGPVKEVVDGAMSVFRREQAASVERMTAIVEAQPKNVVRQWRWSIFPDDDRAGNYQYLIKKLSMVALVGMPVACLFLLGVRWMDKSYAYRAGFEQASTASVGGPGGKTAADAKTVMQGGKKGAPGGGTMAPGSLVAPRVRHGRGAGGDRRVPGVTGMGPGRAVDTLNKKQIRINRDSLENPGD